MIMIVFILLINLVLGAEINCSALSDNFYAIDLFFGFRSGIDPPLPSEIYSYVKYVLGYDPDYLTKSVLYHAHSEYYKSVTNHIYDLISCYNTKYHKFFVSDKIHIKINKKEYFGVENIYRITEGADFVSINNVDLNNWGTTSVVRLVVLGNYVDQKVQFIFDSSGCLSVIEVTNI